MSPLPVDTTLDLQNVNKIVNVPAPTQGGDAVNKNYVDAVAQGIIYKQAVQAVSTDDVAVNNPGAIGTVTAGERVLLVGQTDASQNGIWTYNGPAAALTRPDDFATASDQKPGVAAFDEGTNATWTLINTADVTVDTTDQQWSKGAAAGSLTFEAPLTQDGDTVSLNGGQPLPVAYGGTGSGTASGARTNLGAVGKYAETVGDGTATTFTVSHNLGTTDVTVQAFDMATGNLELVATTIESNNSVQIGFGSAPAAAGGALGSGTGKRVVVTG